MKEKHIMALPLPGDTSCWPCFHVHNHCLFISCKCQFNCFDCYIWLSSEGSFYVLMPVFINYLMGKHSLQSYGLYFYSLSIMFWQGVVLNFVKSILLILSFFWVWCFSSVSKKSSHNPNPYSVALLFFWNYLFLSPTFMNLIHLSSFWHMNIVWGMK